MSLLGVVAAGCNVGPDFRRPEVALNHSWSSKDDPRIATQAATDSRWWGAFNDLVLDQLIEIADRQNLSLQVAGLRIVEARAQLGLATGKQFPQRQEISAGATAVGLPQQLANIYGADRLPRNFLTYDVGFDAVWELDFWGKYRRGVQAETASLFATVADYYAALVSLNAEVARTYAMVRTYEVLGAQARQNVQLQEDGLRITESRFRNGATTELDVTQATTLVESTKATVPEFAISEQQARNALSTLLGQTTGTVDALLAGSANIPSAPAIVPAGLPAEMLRRRPDIRSAELTAAAQCARIGVAKADLYPSFSLFGSIGLAAAASGSASHNLFSGESFYYSAGPQVTWPFFNYGRLTNNVRVQDARFQQLLVDYRSKVLEAAREVEDAMVAFLRTQDQVAFEENAVKAAQRSVDIAIAAYQQGAVDYQRVLDAQRSLLQVENALTQTRSAVAINVIALYKALGGGWQLGPETQETASRATAVQPKTPLP